MFSTPDFWVLMAFILLFLLGGKKIIGSLKEFLDEHRQKITKTIKEAEHLHEEALSLLNSYKKKHEEALQQAEKIIAHAEKEALEFKRDQEKEFEKFVEQKEKAVFERIGVEQEEAKSKLRKEAADEALALVEKVLLREKKEKKRLTQASLKEISAIAGQPTKKVKR